MSEAKGFKRHVNPQTIKNLVNEDLYKQKLKLDIDKGVVFPAIRSSNEIHFYYCGGRIFEYNGAGFKTHYKYYNGLDAPTQNKDYYNEIALGSFAEKYDNILKNCEKRQRVKSGNRNEKNVLSKLYDYSFFSKEAKKDLVLLDIEIGFPKLNRYIDGIKPNNTQIDLLIYDKKSNKLTFVEGKDGRDKRLKQLKEGTKTISVTWQIKCYRELIKHHESNIREAYENYFKILKDLGIELECAMPKVDLEPKLLIYNSKNTHKKTIDKLQEDLKDNLFLIEEEPCDLSFLKEKLD